MAAKPTPFPPPSSLPLPFLQPAWFLMVGGCRIFKLALTERKSVGKSEEGRKRGVSVSEVVSPPYIYSVCVGMEVSCKQS